MKKIRLLFLFFLMCASAFATDIQFRILPAVNLPLDIPLSPSFSVCAALDIVPFKSRERDNIFFTVQGTYDMLHTEGLENFHGFDISIGAGYEYRIIDRLSITGEVLAGIWTIPSSIQNNLPSATGYSMGAKISANFHLLPFLTVGAFAGYKYYGSDIPFMSSIEAGASIKLNISKALITRSDIKVKEMELSPLFPVLYSYYDTNKFGTITFVNNESNKITDVTVSIFIEELMSNESTIKTYDSIPMGQEFSVDLTAFLNENILTSIMKHKTTAKVTVSYSSLGLRTRHTENIELMTLGRNNMSWDDDARAVTFISGKDASVARFARYLRMVMKDRLTASEPENIQYARGVFAALKAYGINYVVDPSSAFIDNIGSSSIDFLQFPYQTLLYHGGDCDDLTILNCSMMEALGIETALITIPGHIYMAFDSGYTVQEASKISDGNYIIYDDVVWIPVEITLCHETFQKAKKLGYREWILAGDEANLIPVHPAWEKYNPVSIHDSDTNFELPSINKIINNLY